MSPTKKKIVDFLVRSKTSLSSGALWYFLDLSLLLFKTDIIFFNDSMGRRRPNAVHFAVDIYKNSTKGDFSKTKKFSMT